MKSITGNALAGLALLFATAAAGQPDWEPADSAPVETVPVDAEPAAPATGEARLPYTWGAGRFRHVENDDVAFDGFGVEGSHLLSPNVYAIGAFVVGETDETPASDSTQAELGAGYRFGLTPAMDLSAALRFIKLDTKRDTGPVADEVGYQLDAGARGLLFERLEWAAGAAYVHVFEAGHAFATGSAYYRVLWNLSVGAEASFGNSSTSYGVIGRWAF